MKIYECAGFGELITPPWLERLKRVAVGARQEIPNGAHHEDIERLVGELMGAELEMILHINGWLWLDRTTGRLEKDEHRKLEPGDVGAVVRSCEAALGAYGNVAYEIGNEINLDPLYQHGENRGHLRECLSAAAAETDRPIIAANVSNVARDDGMKHLRAWARMLDGRFAIGIHPYRTTSRWNEFDGYEDFSELLDELRDIAGERKVYVTEASWHDWKQTSGGWPFKRTTQWTPTEVAEFTARDIAIWELIADVYVHYQLRDAAPGTAGWKHHDGHFGAFTADGRIKEVGAMLEARRAA